MDFVNPVRQSVWKDQEFRDKLDEVYPGYLEMLTASAPGAKINFTPQPLFFDLTTEWAATLQKMVAKEVPVDEGLDQLAAVDRPAAQGSRPGLIAKLRERGRLPPWPAPIAENSLVRFDALAGSGHSHTSWRPACGSYCRWSFEMSAVTAQRRPASRFRISKRALPYVLSLPALLVCIGILIPFLTAVVYSFQRYRLSQPWARQFNWGENYLNFLTDSGFWNTVLISLIYAALTVGLELLLGLGIALLLQKRTTLNNLVSILLLMPLMTAPALAALMWKLMTNPSFGILSYLASLLGLTDFRWASAPSTRAVHRRAGRHLGLHALHHDPAAGRPALAADAAFRGGGARRRAAQLRLLPHHPADADALHPDRDAVPPARFHPAVRHHLRHDAGRPGRHAHSSSRSRPI